MRKHHELANILVQILQSGEDKETREIAILGLWRVDPGNQEAITALVKLIQSTDDENIRRQGLKELFIWDVGFEKTKAIAELVQLLHSIEDENIRRQVAEALGTIDNSNPIAIAD